MGRKLSLKLILTIAVVCVGASFQFYNYAVINPPQGIIQLWMNRTFQNRYGIQLSDSSLTFLFSFTVSCTAFGVLAENLGRRTGLVANGIVNLFAALAVGLAKGVSSPELLIVGRFVLGMNLGITSGLVPMYLSEISPIQYRGAISSCHQLGVAFSDFFSLVIGLPEVLGSDQFWPLAFALSGLPALIMCMVLPFCPESPRYLLITKGDRAAAQAAVKFFSVESHEREHFNGIVREAAASISFQNRQYKLSDLVQIRELRTPLLISILVMIAQQFTGVAAIFAYSTDMFQQADLSIRAARFATVGIGFGYFLCSVPAIYLIEKLGRRKISLAQLCGCLFSLTAMTIFTALRLKYNFNWAAYANIAALVVYMCFYGFGSAVPWMITSELFSQDFRSAAVSVATFTAWFWAFVISMAYLPFQRAVGVMYSFLPFIAVLLVSIVLMALLLPETKGKSIDEIVRDFRRRRTEVSRRLTIGGGADPPELEPLIAAHFKKGYYGREARKFSRLSTFSELSELSSTHQQPQH